MNNHKYAVQSQYAVDSATQLLTRPVSALLGVTSDGARVMKSLGIVTIFDLGASSIFDCARQIVLAASQSPGADTARVAGDFVDLSLHERSPKELAKAPVSALRSIREIEAEELNTALSISTIQELAEWPPYREAKSILNEAYSPIPILPPEIAPMQAGGKANNPTIRTAPREGQVLNIINPPSLPDPERMYSKMDLIIPQDQLIEQVRLMNKELRAGALELREWMEKPDGMVATVAASTFVKQFREDKFDTKQLCVALEEYADGFTTLITRYSKSMQRHKSLTGFNTVMINAFAKANGNADLGVSSAKLLALGALSLGYSAPMRATLFDTLLGITFKADAMSWLVRATLLGTPGRWKPNDGLFGLDVPLIPGLEAGACLASLRAAAIGAGGFASSYLTGFDKMPEVSVQGIMGISPNRGSCSTRVSLSGSFPVPQPIDTFVYFPTADGGQVPVRELSWGTSQIEVLTPSNVGDGPVGFVKIPGGFPQGNPGALMEFAGAVSECLGPQAAGRLARFTQVIPVRPTLQVPPIPALQNDINVFHGGPILGRITPSTVAEDSTLTINGKNLERGDQVFVDKKPCPTTFINSSQLSCTLAGVGIGGGPRLVLIRRGHCESNLSEIYFIPSLTTTQLPRAVPDQWLTLRGNGFTERINVLIEGESANVHVLDTYSLNFQVFRPVNIRAVGDTDYVDVEVFSGATKLGKLTLPIDTFRIVSFGDSIMWGQGLLEGQKFTRLVADYLATTPRRWGRRVLCLDRMAHSGAQIAPSPSDPDPATLDRSVYNVTGGPGPQDLRGERPSSEPSITVQVAAWGTLPADERSHIDLILIDGGINDVDVRNIINPVLLDDDLETRTRAVCGVEMTNVLTTLLTIFPSAQVVVTGYYQIVSKESDLDELWGVAGVFGLLTALIDPTLGVVSTIVLKEFVRERMIHRSNLFATTANEALQSAINSVLGTGRSVRLAIPQWGPRNALFAPDSYTFAANIVQGLFSPNDPQASARGSLCNGNLFCEGASIGHPNPRGAQAYADAIIRALTRP